MHSRSWSGGDYRAGPEIVSHLEVGTRKSMRERDNKQLGGRLNTRRMVHGHVRSDQGKLTEDEET